MAHYLPDMKTFRVYFLGYVDIEANSEEEAEEVAGEMDYSFSHNGDEFSAEIYSLEETEEKKIDNPASKD